MITRIGWKNIFYANSIRRYSISTIFVSSRFLICDFLDDKRSCFPIRIQFYPTICPIHSSRYTVEEAKLLLSPPPSSLRFGGRAKFSWKVSKEKKKRSFPKWNRSNSNPPSIRADINFNLSPLHDSRIHGVLGILLPRFRRGSGEERSANRRPGRKWVCKGGGRERRMLLVGWGLFVRKKIGENWWKHIFLTDIWWNLRTFSNDPCFLIFQYLISKFDIRIRSNFFSSLSCYWYLLWWWMMERKKRVGEEYMRLKVN